MYFEAFLSLSWRDGNCCGRHLFHDVKQRGDTGSFSNLERPLSSWRRAERPGEDSESPASTISINQPAARPHTESLDRPYDLAGSRRGPLDQASGCADDQPGQKGRRPKAGSLPLCAGLPCPSAACCGACELGKLDTSIDLASPGSSPSRVSVWSYAVTLTPLAMPLNCRGETARRKG